MTVTRCVDVSRAKKLSSGDAGLMKVFLACVGAELTRTFVEAAKALVAKQTRLAFGRL